MKEVFQQRRDLILGLLKEIPGVKCNTPDGAFYVFPDVSSYYGKKTEDGTTIENGDQLCEYILEKAYVALVAGSAFGADECIRISYAASDKDIIESCRRLKVVLEKLK